MYQRIVYLGFSEIFELDDALCKILCLIYTKNWYNLFILKNSKFMFPQLGTYCATYRLCYEDFLSFVQPYVLREKYCVLIYTTNLFSKKILCKKQKEEKLTIVKRLTF